VAAQPPLQLGPGEYYAVRVHQFPAGGPGSGADVDLRSWAAGDRGRTLTLVNGRVQRTVPTDAPPDAGRLPDWSTFPTDPAALARRMRADAATLAFGDHSTPTARDYVLSAAGMVFGAKRVPPATLRAAYDFLAGLPGIRLVGDVTDPLGRPGTAVAADGDADTEGIGVELILDRVTGLPLAVVDYRDGDVQDPWLYTTRQEGVVRGTDALPG
jgi:hypothetical protein